MKEDSLENGDIEKIQMSLFWQQFEDVPGRGPFAGVGIPTAVTFSP